MNTTASRLVGLLLCLPLVGLAAAAETGKKDESIAKSDLPPRLEGLKRDFDRLVKMMFEASRLLAKSNPEASKSLSEAADLAQRAFIADNLVQAAKELERGLAGKALGTESAVIKDMGRLITMLKYGAMGIDQQLAELEKWKKQLEAIDRHIKDQTQQLAVANAKRGAESISQQMARHAEDLERIIKNQKALRAAAQQSKAPGKAVEQLSALRDKIRDLIGKQESLREATATAATTQLAKAGVIQKALSDRAAKLSEQIARAGQSKELAAALDKAGAGKAAIGKAAKGTGEAAGNMKQAGKALDQMDRTGASKGQNQALENLRAAEKALSQAMSKAAGAEQARKQAGEQAELAKRTAELKKGIEATSQAAGQQPKTAHLSRAGKQMAQAGEKLGARRPAQAAENMSKALKELQAQKTELAQLAKSIKKQADTPSGEQASNQKGLAKSTGQTAKSMQGSQQATATPGQPSVQKAAGQMDKAAKQLEQDNQDQAANSQKRALDDLARARDELERQIEEAEADLQNRQLAQIDRMLTKILQGQQAISKSTKDVHKKRPAAGPYARAEQLELTKLARGEGLLGDQVQEVRDLLVAEDSTVVFPVILGQVKDQMQTTGKLLTGHEAGPFVQTAQRRIEQDLEALLVALREEQTRRRRRGKGGGGGGGPKPKGKGDEEPPPLVPPVAELKMLRALQIRIARRTVQLAKAKAGSAKPSRQILEQHKELADHQGQLVGLTKKMRDKAKNPEKIQPVPDKEAGP